MRERQRVTAYWSVWRLGGVDDHFNGWVPYCEGHATKRAAEKALEQARWEWPEGRFAIVKTRHERVA